MRDALADKYGVCPEKIQVREKREESVLLAVEEGGSSEDRLYEVIALDVATGKDARLFDQAMRDAAFPKQVRWRHARHRRSEGNGGAEGQRGGRP